MIYPDNNHAPFDRYDFPLLHKKVNGHRLVYLDNAATTLKPQSVIDAITLFYTDFGTNVARGIYTIAEQTTAHFEEVRTTVASFIGAQPHEIIFTKGATESINLVAAAWAKHRLVPGDTIVSTTMEHHANILPWQECARSNQLTFIMIPLQPDGALDNIDRYITKTTRLITMSQTSNVLGIQNNIKQVVYAARAVGARVLIDGAQSIPHEQINVKELDVDFFLFSAHKMLGPTGIGILYIKEELHNYIRPYQTGGGMVDHVDIQESIWKKIPARLEAGTPPIAAAFGLRAALEYYKKRITYSVLKKHETSLCKHLIDGLKNIHGVHIYSPIQDHMHMVTLYIDGIHPHDIAAYLDRHGICVRAGFHCAIPLANALGIGPSIRISVYGYNTIDDIDILLNILEQSISKIKGSL